MKKSKQLTLEDAKLIHLMRKTGMYQHAIAAHFGVNQGRISEVLNGHLFPELGDG